MSIPKNELENILRVAFPNACINIVSIANDENHYKLEIVDASFLGKSLISQHKLVKEALKNILLSGILHAVTIHTKSS